MIVQNQPQCFEPNASRTRMSRDNRSLQHTPSRRSILRVSPGIAFANRPPFSSLSYALSLSPLTCLILLFSLAFSWIFPATATGHIRGRRFLSRGEDVGERRADKGPRQEGLGAASGGGAVVRGRGDRSPFGGFDAGVLILLLLAFAFVLNSGAMVMVVCR